MRASLTKSFQCDSNKLRIFSVSASGKRGIFSCSRHFFSGRVREIFKAGTIIICALKHRIFPIALTQRSIAPSYETWLLLIGYLKFKQPEIRCFFFSYVPSKVEFAIQQMGKWLRGEPPKNNVTTDGRRCRGKSREMILIGLRVRRGVISSK